jgi:hypothetical protein
MSKKTTDTLNPMYASVPMPNTSYYPITYQSINFPPVYTDSIEEGPVEELTTGIRVRNGVEIYRKNGDIYEKIGTSPIARSGYDSAIINRVKIIWEEFIKSDLYVNVPMTMPSAGGKRKTRRNRKSKKSRKGKSRKNRRKSNRRR